MPARPTEKRETAPAAADLPLLAAPRPGAPLAWFEGHAVSASAYLADVRATAALLENGGTVVNLCVDRYRFSVALGAALLRSADCLLPPNAMPATLAALGEPRAPRRLLVDAPDSALPASWPQVPVVDQAARTAKVVDASAEDDAELPCIDESHVAARLLTSGSTGAPQPHGKSWGTLTLNIGAEAARLAECLGRDDLRGVHLVATVPPQHSYGFESSVLLALLGGAVLHHGRPFYPADIADALRAVPRPRALVTTPLHLKTLLNAEGVDLPDVDLVLSATAPLSPQLAQLAETRTGGQLIEIYGCTEAGQVATRRTAQTDVWTTFRDVRMRRVDSDGEERYAVEGGHVRELTPLSDLLELVDENRFRLLGRANDLINVAGKRSSLGHLNHQLNSIPGVDDGAFWMPDPRADEVVRPLAFVVTRTLGAAQVRSALRERIEPAFVPRRIVVVPTLPREATGKITTAALNDFAQATLAKLPARRRSGGGSP